MDFLEPVVVVCLASNELGNVSSFVTELHPFDYRTDVFDDIVIELKENKKPFQGFGFLQSHPRSLQNNHIVQVYDGSSVTLECRGLLTNSESLHLGKGTPSSPLGSEESSASPSCNGPPDKMERFCSSISYSTVSASEYSTELSQVLAFKFNATQRDHCSCWTCTNTGTNISVAILLKIARTRSPRWSTKLFPETLDLHEDENLNLTCVADGEPSPTIIWKKDDGDLELADNRIKRHPTHLEMERLKITDSGLYQCLAQNQAGELRQKVFVRVTSAWAASVNTLLTVVAIVSVLLAFLSLIVAYRIFVDKKKQMKIRKEEQEIFEATSNEPLDPTLSPVEQSDILPFKPSYNIDKNRLILERQIGVGAFGRVYRAQLTSTTPGEEPATVAVKTIKSKTNTEHLRSFRSEIKILMYIGRHRNIINLIGVCCKDMVEKGEMLMVVEFCRNNSLLDYMRKQRSACNTSAKAAVRSTCSSGDSNIFSFSMCDQSASNAQVSNTGSVVRWAKEYQNTGDLATPESPTLTARANQPNTPLLNTSPTPEQNRLQIGALSAKLLLGWAHQVANGMAFLAGKKIIHGDLAARNLLLTEDNVVKIADFGLAKDVYNKTNNLYKPSSKNRSFALRWAALENIRFCEFSSMSDVWSFGVVMWEIFSLGGHPYRELELQELLPHLQAGVRLPRPPYCNDRLYTTMLRCWEQNPLERPSFEILEQILKLMYDKVHDTVGMDPVFQLSDSSNFSLSEPIPYSGIDQNTACTYLSMDPSYRKECDIRKSNQGPKPLNIETAKQIIPLGTSSVKSDEDIQGSCSVSQWLSCNANGSASDVVGNGEKNAAAQFTPPSRYVSHDEVQQKPIWRNDEKTPMFEPCDSQKPILEVDDTGENSLQYQGNPGYVFI